MKAYLEILKRIYTRGTQKHPTRDGERTKFDTIGLPNQPFSHDGNFPLLTTRKLPWNGIVGELRAFLEGCTNNADFVARGCNFWTPWAPADGDLGPVYGAQWQRDLPHILHCLQEAPTDRRMVCSAWRSDEHDKMVLPPCHVTWIATVYDGALNLSWIQRSCDFPIGVPCNIASYGLLLHRLADWGGLRVGNLSALFVDAHIYLNQMEGVATQIRRRPRELPQVVVRGSRTDFNDWDVLLSGYDPYPNIKFGELEI